MGSKILKLSIVKSNLSNIHFSTTLLHPLPKDFFLNVKVPAPERNLSARSTAMSTATSSLLTYALLVRCSHSVLSAPLLLRSIFIIKSKIFRRGYQSLRSKPHLRKWKSLRKFKRLRFYREDLKIEA